ncbi:hypothetical protein [Staphylococcus phage Stab20]|nr:hypothetical protein [Staphylococcus phage Stab20]VEV88343.1 hypothetical protein [Staphylococcus phage Stab20]
MKMTNNKDFNKNFLRLLKVKNVNDKRVQGFINKHDIKLKDKEESSQGYVNVLYKGYDFVISKDYAGQTALYVNMRNLGVDYKHFKHLDFNNIVKALERKNINHVEYKETKTQQYKEFKHRQKTEKEILTYYEKDIEKLKEELERTQKIYNDKVKKIENYDKKISRLKKSK